MVNMQVTPNDVIYLLANFQIFLRSLTFFPIFYFPTGSSQLTRSGARLPDPTRFLSDPHASAPFLSLPYCSLDPTCYCKCLPQSLATPVLRRCPAARILLPAPCQAVLQRLFLSGSRHSASDPTPCHRVHAVGHMAGVQ
jgi:hypothetical protein